VTWLQRNALCLVIAIAAGASGCSRAAPPDAADEARPLEPPAPIVAQPEPAPQPCRDWSNEDLSGLPPLPAGPHVETLDEVWRTVVEKHYDPTLGCIDWASIRRSYAARVAETEDRQQAYATINEMLDELAQSHFRLFEGDGGEDAMLPASVPLQVRWIEGTLVVVRSEVSEVPPGAVLEAIDGTGVADMIARAKSRTKGQSDSAFAFAAARAAMVALSCRKAGVPKPVRMALPGAEASVERVVHCAAPTGELVSLGNLTNVPTRVEHRMLEGTAVGHLAFNVWMLPMIERVRGALAELRAQGMQALVLDLRGNPGGVGPMSVPVARMLLDRPANLGTLRFRSFAQTFNVEPDDDPFTGPVALLVDEGTASTSEIFAAGMRDIGRVTIFGGQPTAGAALPSVIEELPSGAVLQYVVGDYHSPTGAAVEGKGIAPDVRVDETVADFAAGRDPVLEAAAAHLQSILETKE
jgi:carboxyl-terminal processing protease